MEEELPSEYDAIVLGTGEGIVNVLFRSSDRPLSCRKIVK